MFTATVLATLTTDLLWGIVAGMIVKLALEVWISSRVERAEGHESFGAVVLRHASQVGELFRNPVVQCVSSPEGYHLYFARPLVCFNALHLNKALAQIPKGASAVYFHVTDLVTLIDHTSTTTLFEFVDEFKRSGRGIAEVLGLERLRPQSHARACLRLSPPLLARERAQALRAMTRLSLTVATPKELDLMSHIDHLSLTSHDPSVLAPLGHPISAFAGRISRALDAAAREVLAFLLAPPSPMAESANARRGLDSLSLSGPSTRSRAPSAALSSLSLSQSKWSSPARPRPDEDEDNYEIPLM